MTEPRKLNRVVIKEELVALTGDFKLAIVLNQMIYWAITLYGPYLRSVLILGVRSGW